MRLVFRRKTANKVKTRMKTKARIRKKVMGTPERPRLTVFRSARYIYAQIVDDVTGKTLVEASSLTMDLSKEKGKIGKAKAVGAEIAKRAQQKNINQVVFDRSGFLYHGRIQSLATGAREAGLKF